jgi:hypothetical protein
MRLLSVQCEAGMAYKGTAIVGFVDLLGFSARLRETWGTPEDCLDVLLRIKTRLQTVGTGKLEVNFQSGNDRSANAHTKVALFSDSIIIVSTCPNLNHVDQVAMATLAILCQVSAAVTAIAEEGFGSRGGVELGEVWWNEQEAIGPAFLTAYALETRAKLARVIVGPAFLEYWSDRRIFEYIPEYLYRCSDNLFAVRPVDAGNALSAVRQAAPAELKARYDEVIAHSPAQGPSSTWRRAWLRSGAESTAALLR